MPRKSKDELKNNKNAEVGIKNQKEKMDEKKNTSKKEPTSATKKSKNTSKSKTINRSSPSKVTKKSTTAKSKTPKKSSARKTSKKDLEPIVEYYDLPDSYNETTVKILAQTPKMLFVYWDISDKDRTLYSQKYGEDFFNKTKPILIVRNKTMNYTFEVEINDFANSWYVHVNDANCDYSVELGRRPIFSESNITEYINMATSNDIDMPNNRILFDTLGESVFFKNVKNNIVTPVPITSISFMKRLGKIYSVYDLYKEMYRDEINLEELKSNNIKLDLSSSSSSTFM